VDECTSLHDIFDGKPSDDERRWRRFELYECFLVVFAVRFLINFVNGQISKRTKSRNWYFLFKLVIIVWCWPRHHRHISLTLAVPFDYKLYVYHQYLFKKYRLKWCLRSSNSHLKCIRLLIPLKILYPPTHCTVALNDYWWN